MGTDDFRNVSVVYGLESQIRLLPLILMFQRRIGTSIMCLIKILLIVFLLDLLMFVLLMHFA
jgi:hypothetical protein